MMRLFRRYVLGGKSDKTEGTLLAFLIGVAWFTFIIWKVSRGVDMEPVIAPTAWVLAATVGAFTGVTSLNHLKPPQPPQVPGQGGPEGYPEGDAPWGAETPPDGALRRGDVGA